MERVIKRLLLGQGYCCMKDVAIEGKQVVVRYPVR